MARFAKLEEDNTVLGVHVIDDNKVSDENGVNETIGQNILHKIHGWSKWALTDGHTVNGKYYTPGTSDLDPDQSKAFRGNKASRGSIWDPAKEIFYSQQPYSSWTLNEATASWEAPVTFPTITTYNDDRADGDGDPLAPYDISWDEVGQKWTANTTISPITSFNWNTDTLTWDSA